MAVSKKSQTKPNGDNEVKFKGFINYTPNEKDKKDYETAASSTDLIGGILPRVLETGLKLSCVFVERNACFSATLFDKDAASPFAGWCLSVRAGNPVSAIERVVWLHYYRFDGDWDNALADGRTGDEW